MQKALDFVKKGTYIVLVVSVAWVFGNRILSLNSSMNSGGGVPERSASGRISNHFQSAVRSFRGAWPTVVHGLFFNWVERLESQCVSLDRHAHDAHVRLGSLESWAR